jgi:hypothetical protein
MEDRTGISVYIMIDEFGSSKCNPGVLKLVLAGEANVKIVVAP